MKLLVSIFFVALFAKSFATPIENFNDFKVAFHKHYDSIENEITAKLNFERSLQWIKDNKDKYDHEIGITSLADIDDDYFVKLPSTLLTSNGNHSHHSEPVKVTLPESYDWRDHIHMHEPEAQGRCGSCWAFVSATCMEARLAIKDKINVHLSRQELLDCTKKIVKSNNGCQGGHAYDGWEYAIKDGVHDDSAYPYHQQQGVCHNDVKGKKYFMKSVHHLKYRTTDEDLMANLIEYGPLNVNIFANHNEFKFYKGGLMKNLYPNNTDHNHAVVLIGWGYDTKEKLPYWIVRNSWGLTWGDKGYGYVERKINSMGMNDFVSFPL